MLTTDFSWRPAASGAARALRARSYRRIRDFFEQRNVMEVETPTLSRYGNPDAMIHSLMVRGDGKQHYLRTSPEFPLKRLLAADNAAIYELGRVYRGDEFGRHHNLEFTMLEWYRPGFDHHALMNEVEALVSALFNPEGKCPSVCRRSFCDVLSVYFADVLEASDDQLGRKARDLTKLEGNLTRTESLDLLLNQAVAAFSPDQLTFIYDFPACQSALARLSQEDSRVAHRFEVFMGSLEIANGYFELCDPVELEQRLDDENRRREKLGMNPVPVDVDLLAATVSGIEDCSGVAMGMDRLLMALGGYGHIRDVLNFPGSLA